MANMIPEYSYTLSTGVLTAFYPLTVYTTLARPGFVAMLSRGIGPGPC